MNIKKIIKLIFCFVVLAIAAIIAFNINANSKVDGLSGISIANVEALAQREAGEADCGAWCIDSRDWDCVLVTNWGNTYTCYYRYAN